LMSLTDLFVVSTLPRKPLPVVHPKDGKVPQIKSSASRFI
jgi:hypothetical protein